MRTFSFTNCLWQVVARHQISKLLRELDATTFNELVMCILNIITFAIRHGVNVMKLLQLSRTKRLSLGRNSSVSAELHEVGRVRAVRVVNLGKLGEFLTRFGLNAKVRN